MPSDKWPDDPVDSNGRHYANDKGRASADRYQRWRYVFTVRDESQGRNREGHAANEAGSLSNDWLVIEFWEPISRTNSQDESSV